MFTIYFTGLGWSLQPDVSVNKCIPFFLQGKDFQNQTEERCVSIKLQMSTKPWILLPARVSNLFQLVQKVCGRNEWQSHAFSHKVSTFEKLPEFDVLQFLRTGFVQHVEKDSLEHSVQALPSLKLSPPHCRLTILFISQGTIILCGFKMFHNRRKLVAKLQY